MPRKKIPCAVCGEPMNIGSTSAPVGEAKHRSCAPVVHGATRYGRYGCRCDVCRAAAATAAKAYGERRRDAGRPVRPSPEVRKRSRENEKRRGYTEALRRRDAARRARKLGATVEPFNSVEIFERDGWTCLICGDPIDRWAPYPHPDSVSLDHVVPLSRGGEHSRANTRCSHLRCNLRRGNRMEVGA